MKNLHQLIQKIDKCEAALNSATNTLLQELIKKMNFEFLGGREQEYKDELSILYRSDDGLCLTTTDAKVIPVASIINHLEVFDTISFYDFVKLAV